MKAFVDPFPVLALWAALALVNLYRRRPGSRRDWLLLVVPAAVMFVLSTPAAGYLAMASLERCYPPLEDPPADCQAIVVLSGYAYPPDEVRLKSAPADDTLGRCVCAAQLYRRIGPLPVLASGGKIDSEASDFTLAGVMRDFLRTQGIPENDLLVETESTNTFENAKESARLLRGRGVRRVALVTDATHLRRAERCFRSQGIETVPCGCRYRATRISWSVLSLLPDPSGARGVQLACHEWLGMAWYRLSGKID